MRVQRNARCSNGHIAIDRSIDRSSSRAACEDKCAVEKHAKKQTLPTFSLKLEHAAPRRNDAIIYRCNPSTTHDRTHNTLHNDTTTHAQRNANNGEECRSPTEETRGDECMCSAFALVKSILFTGKIAHETLRCAPVLMWINRMY